MESDSSPEFINPLGLELTQKIVEMMRHPKSDVDPRLVDETHLFDGIDKADELMKYDRMLLSAYHESVSGLTVYLKMPEPGSPQLHDLDARWEVFIKVPFEVVEDAEIVKTYLIKIDETSYDVTFTQGTLVYVDGRLQRDPRMRPRFDPDNVEGSLHAYFEAEQADKEFAEQLGLNDYTQEYHEQVMEVLDSFSEENEVLTYDPANGRGLFY